jgi:amino acid transporter
LASLSPSSCVLLPQFATALDSSLIACKQSIITGITTLFSYGLATGGPGVMSVGWIVVSIFTMFVALGMAEIVSAIPTAGGPYYWAAMLAPAKHSAFASWITGW